MFELHCLFYLSLRTCTSLSPKNSTALRRQKSFSSSEGNLSSPDLASSSDLISFFLLFPLIYFGYPDKVLHIPFLTNCLYSNAFQTLVPECLQQLFYFQDY